MDDPPDKAVVRHIEANGHFKDKKTQFKTVADIHPVLQCADQQHLKAALRSSSTETERAPSAGVHIIEQAPSLECSRHQPDRTLSNTVQLFLSISKLLLKKDQNEDGSGFRYLNMGWTKFKDGTQLDLIELIKSYI